MLSRPDRPEEVLSQLGYSKHRRVAWFETRDKYPRELRTVRRKKMTEGKKETGGGWEEKSPLGERAGPTTQDRMGWVRR